MALFQKSVLNKYLQETNVEALNFAWKNYNTYFLNTTIQNNIIASKEEEFQEGFLRELFVKILGYTINPDPNFNLITELKNEKDAKKADAAIVTMGLNPLDKTVLAIIELKSTKTTDLNKIEIQAFNYKNNQANCKYVITSNFQKIRFYIDNAIEYIEWDLFKLDFENFKTLFLCLYKENIFNHIPASIKTESLTIEENVTKQLYKEYSQFRKSLFNNIVEQNQDVDKLLLFKKTQKILDRFLFLFFAEDKMLVPPNSVREILKQWTALNEMDAYQPLYNRFKLYFGYLNTGHKGKLHDIFAYNGGLFATDEILDNIIIDDNILYNATLSLSNYDYNSEVDVNILGHIFEHSLTEIEDIEKELDNGLKPIAGSTSKPIASSSAKPIEKTSKRKKEGVFYTPKYITKYIVENTIGTLCKNKKTELQIEDADYHPLQKKNTVKKLLENLTNYRNWLLQITIIDPACGSGAFLNQALEYLIAEHKYISELEANITGSSIVFDVENSILENNLFGVDINEESVEIAKLSLWLRTAQKGRKLNSLNNNIKCGNSLIDDVTVAGEKAFNWQEQFPKVFNGHTHNELYFVTFVTHNSRVSERMVHYNSPDFIEGLKPFVLNKKQKILIANSIIEICKKNKIYILALNILPDHVHIVIQACNKNDLDNKVRKIKGGSSFALNRSEEIGINENKVWAQKYHSKMIEGETMLNDVIEYVSTNHYKHSETWGTNLIDEYELDNGLNNELNNGLKPIVTKALIHPHDYYATEGGFDVVIGNPPYVFARDNFHQNEKDFYVNEYVSAKYQINTYLLFIEKSVRILKQNGIFGLIIPNAWLMVYSGEGLRKYLLKNCNIFQIINLKGYSFESANVETVILLAKNQSIHQPNSLEIYLNNGTEFYLSHTKNQLDFKNNEGSEFKVFIDNESDYLNLKINNNTFILDDLVEIKAGLQAYEKDKGEPKQSAVDVVNRPYDYNYKFDENTHQYLEGKDVGRYFTNWAGAYLKYGKHLAAPRTINLFDGKKIIVREITGNYPKCIISTYTEYFYLYNRSNIGIIEKSNLGISLKYIVSILNSSLMSYYFMKNTAKSVRKLFPKIILNDLRKFPIKKINYEAQLPFILLAETMLTKNKELQQANAQFQQFLTSKFTNININTKLEKWFTLSFTEFNNELSKQLKTMGLSPLPLTQQNEWLQFFEQEKQKALDIKNEIDATDKLIDKMVYELYDLTEEEIKIIETS